LVNFVYFQSYSILKGVVPNYEYPRDAPCTKLGPLISYFIVSYTVVASISAGNDELIGWP
jgi:hypothetical protein